MFYPKLTRRQEDFYYNNRKKFYADYSQNYVKVAEDCQFRCVYCDITIEESGGDEMHLDHFRPQEHFPDLSTHPFNLYLACPKCNGLKTSDWPCSKEHGAATFIGGVGYLDRFNHDAETFLRVDNAGCIVAVAGPVGYMIKKMHLNRPSRVNVRRKRQVEFRKTRLLQGVLELTKKLKAAEENKTLKPEQIAIKRGQIGELMINYASLV